MQHETRCHIRLLAACSCLTTNTRSCCELPSAPGHRPLQRRLLLSPPLFSFSSSSSSRATLLLSGGGVTHHWQQIIHITWIVRGGGEQAQLVGRESREGGVLSHLAITSVWTWPLPAIKWHTLSRNAFVCCPESEIYAILDTSCVPKGI